MSNQKVWSEVFLGEPDAPTHYKINKFTNLIPVEVEYEENGDRRTVLGYMDYATQNIRFVDAKLHDEGMFREAVLGFMMRRNAKHLDAYQDRIPTPPAVDVSDLSAKANQKYEPPARGRVKETDGTDES